MRLDLIVGPDGAGKTTIAELVLSRTRLATPLVNADVIADQRWPGDTARHAYEAATNRGAHQGRSHRGQDAVHRRNRVLARVEARSDSLSEGGEPRAAVAPAPAEDRPMRIGIKIMLVAAIILDLLYWTLWFADRASIASLRTESYYRFEDAFPLADAWLGVVCVLALVSLQRRRPTALLGLIAAGSAGLYLGSMDLLYDLENDIFATGVGGVIELVIVVLTWTFSITALGWSWRHRRELLHEG